MRQLAVSVLGPFAATVDGVPVTAFEYSKVRALLAYLAVEADHPHTRVKLATLLWPDQPERSARASLSQALTTLRGALGDKAAERPLLLADVHQVQLAPGCVVVDAAQFLGALRTAEGHAHQSWRTCPTCAERLRQALDLYRGHFLADVTIGDSEVFAEWAALQREHLLQRALSALQRLVEWAQWRGAYGEASSYAQRLVALDSLLEENQRALMRALALNGETAAALAQYQQLRDLLAQELAAAPEEATSQLFDQLRRGDTAGLRPSAPPFAVPMPPTRLIGRDEELRAVCMQLRDADGRVLTVTGAGGIGKTRLALAAAHTLRYDFEDGVYFVELAVLDDAALVADTVAQALGVKEQPRQTMGETLSEHLRAKHLLLVLDNFEHLAAAAPLVSQLLAVCPQLRVLATSRAPLHVRGEQIYPLGPLPLPDDQQPLALAALGAVAAVQLFVQRAQFANPAFVLTASNAALVAAICRRLDGLPLALELAAPRLRLLDPAALLIRLDHALPLLSDGARDLPARQRTIEATIRWSYDLLTPDEQALFRSMAVFVGSADLPAITSVGRPLGDEAVVLDLLDRLVAQSLVLVADNGRGDVRYRLLEPVRQFALTLLEASGEATEVRGRHAALYLRVAERAHPELRRAQQLLWLDRLARDHDNLRAALGWSLQSGDAETAARISWSLWPFWWIRSHHREGRRWTEAVRASAAALSPLALRQVTMAAATMAYGQDDEVAVEQHINELVALSAACGGDPHAEAFASSGFGLVAIKHGRFPEALAHLERARQLLEQSDEAGMAAQAHTWIGTVLLLMGDYDAARSRFATGLAAGRAIGDHLSMTNALFNLGQMALATGEYQQAVQWLREGIPLSQQMDDRANVAYICEGLAVAATALGQYERAASLFGAAEGLIERIGLRGHTYYQPDRSRQNQAVAALRRHLGETGYTSARAAGRLLSFEEVVDYALRV